MSVKSINFFVLKTYFLKQGRAVPGCRNTVPCSTLSTDWKSLCDVKNSIFGVCKNTAYLNWSHLGLVYINIGGFHLNTGDCSEKMVMQHTITIGRHSTFETNILPLLIRSLVLVTLHSSSVIAFCKSERYDSQTI